MFPVVKTNMDDSRLTNVSELADFLESTKGFSLKLEGLAETYQFIDQTVDRFKYLSLKRKEKRVVLTYLRKVTLYKKAQLMRLIQRAKKGELKRKVYVRLHGHRTYTPTDIKLLEATDVLHLRMSGLATREIMRRECEVFGDQRFATISHVSSSHLYNLRDNPIYKNAYINHTKARQIGIGLTMKPENNNCPGSIRIDTVHQRDIYYINAVDEITQWQVVVCVPEISEDYLEPMFIYILEAFPFKVFNFHSDRGVEFINHKVEDILNRLIIKQTKSRSRHSNDNALVESKNGSTIRKNFGYEHIGREAAELVNAYCQTYFTPYLNYHRPCLFVSEIRVDKKGHEKAIYKEAKVPYDKLKEVSTKQKKNFLKPGLIFAELDKIALKQSDNEFAKILRDEERKLFEKIRRMPPEAK